MSNRTMTLRSDTGHVFKVPVDAVQEYIVSEPQTPRTGEQTATVPSKDAARILLFDPQVLNSFLSDLDKRAARERSLADRQVFLLYEIMRRSWIPGQNECVIWYRIENDVLEGRPVDPGVYAKFKKAGITVTQEFIAGRYFIESDHAWRQIIHTVKYIFRRGKK